jgi:hypothetical protein
MKDPERCGVTVAEKPEMAGRNATADNVALSCDAARKGQVDVVSHKQSAKITDRFAKPKQSPAAA